MLWMICVYVNTICIPISYHIFALFNSLYTILFMLNLCVYVYIQYMFTLQQRAVDDLYAWQPYIDTYIIYNICSMSVSNFIRYIAYDSLWRYHITHQKSLMICIFVSPICAYIHEAYHICSV